MGLGGMQVTWRTWEWSLTWSGILGVEGFGPAAANREAYAGMLYGIACCPKGQDTQQARSQRPPAAAAHPPSPGMPYLRPWGECTPPSKRRADYAVRVLALI